MNAYRSNSIIFFLFRSNYKIEFYNFIVSESRPLDSVIKNGERKREKGRIELNENQKDKLRMALRFGAYRYYPCKYTMRAINVHQYVGICEMRSQQLKWKIKWLGRHVHNPKRVFWRTRKYLCLHAVIFSKTAAPYNSEKYSCTRAYEFAIQRKKNKRVGF